MSAITHDTDDVLFDGDDAMFKRVLRRINADPARTAPLIYGEYGCGLSSRWVLNHTCAQVLSVDSSRDWIKDVQEHLTSDQAARFATHWVNLGEIENWGRPTSYSHEHNFELYTNWIWQQAQKPSVVLIDARFRVCSFLTCLKFAEQGALIFFDDYSNRGIYHIVERVLKPTDVCGRHVYFEVPARDEIDFEQVDDLIAKFRYVTD